MKINDTEAVSVAHDRYARVVLDISDEGITPSRDDEIDVLVQGKKRGDLRTCLYSLDVGARYLSLRESSLNGLRQQQRSPVRFLSAFQDRSVPCGTDY